MLVKCHISTLIYIYIRKKQKHMYIYSIYIYIYMRFFVPLGGLLQGWRLGDSQMSFYKQHQRAAFTHRRLTEKNTQRSFYMFLHTEDFTPKCFYTENFLRTEVFTNNSFYLQRLLHREVFTQRSVYTRKLLHRGVFTHRRF